MAPDLTKKQQEEVKKEVEKQVAHQVEHKLNKKVEREVAKKIAKHLALKTTFFGSEFKKHTATALIAAFGFVIALSWRDFILKIFENTTRTNLLQKYPYIAELYTAIVVTIFAVLGIALISRWAKEKNKSNDEKTEEIKNKSKVSEPPN